MQKSEKEFKKKLKRNAVQQVKRLKFKEKKSIANQIKKYSL